MDKLQKWVCSFVRIENSIPGFLSSQKERREGRKKRKKKSGTSKSRFRGGQDSNFTRKLFKTPSILPLISYPCAWHSPIYLHIFACDCLRNWEGLSIDHCLFARLISVSPNSEQRRKAGEKMPSSKKCMTMLSFLRLPTNQRCWPSRGHVAMSGDTLGGHNCREATGVQWAEARGGAKHSAQPPYTPTVTNPAHRVSNAEVRNPNRQKKSACVCVYTYKTEI